MENIPFLSTRRAMDNEDLFTDAVLAFGPLPPFRYIDQCHVKKLWNLTSNKYVVYPM